MALGSPSNDGGGGGKSGGGGNPLAKASPGL